MKCHQCDKQVQDRAAFCHHCGAALAKSGNPAPAAGLRAASRKARENDAPEEEVWEGRYSKLAMIGWWLGALAVSLASIVIGLVAGMSGAGWLYLLLANGAVWLGLLTRYVYLRFSSHYALTTQRFTHRQGILWRQTDRIEVIDIDDVSFLQGPVERMLGIGTVRVSSSDRSHPDLVLPGIENVQTVAGLIDDARRQERQRRGLYIESV